MAGSNRRIYKMGSAPALDMMLSPEASPPASRLDEEGGPYFAMNRLLGKAMGLKGYTLLRPISVKANSAVWLGRNRAGSLRAVKVLLNTTTNRSEFEAETQAVRIHLESKAKCAGTIAICSAHSDHANGVFTYSMELADDLVMGRNFIPSRYSPKTIGAYCGRRERIGLDHVLSLGEQLADLLYQLHLLGFVHGDVSPSNVLFVRGSMKLADLGSLRPIASESACLGTLGFASRYPSATHHVDMHAFAKLIYEIATGSASWLFPELPPRLHREEDSHRLMMLVELLVEICCPQDQRTAAEIKERLKRIRTQGFRSTCRKESLWLGLKGLFQFPGKYTPGAEAEDSRRATCRLMSSSIAEGPSFAKSRIRS
jgi:serine/threonine protein kinase